ncbi:MAG: signal peptidase II [Clostridia bacterium]|nr:signal peptidase II [Clostridia bacterium]
MWKVITLLSVIIIAIAVDLVSKYVLDARLVLDGNEVSAIPHLIDFKLVHNDGAAWGILAGKQAFLIFLAVVFIAIFVWYYIKEKNKTWLLTISVGLLVAGTVGNLFDRIFFGYVRDFLMFDFWKSFPVFNFADVLLCIGVVLFAIYLIVYFVKNKKKVKPEDENGKES